MLQQVRHHSGERKLLPCLVSAGVTFLLSGDMLSLWGDLSTGERSGSPHEKRGRENEKCPNLVPKRVTGITGRNPGHRRRRLDFQD